MPRYRKPLVILTEEQRQAIRDKFSEEQAKQEQWKAEAAKMLGLWETLHSQPLPKGWHWQGGVKYNAHYDIVEAEIRNDANVQKGPREVEIVCTAAEARDREKLWPVIHTCIHGPQAYIPTSGRKTLKVPQCAPAVKKA